MTNSPTAMLSTGGSERLLGAAHPHAHTTHASDTTGCSAVLCGAVVLWCWGPPTRPAIATRGCKALGSCDRALGWATNESGCGSLHSLSKTLSKLELETDTTPGELWRKGPASNRHPEPCPQPYPLAAACRTGTS